VRSYCNNIGELGNYLVFHPEIREAVYLFAVCNYCFHGEFQGGIHQQSEEQPSVICKKCVNKSLREISPRYLSNAPKLLEGKEGANSGDHGNGSRPESGSVYCPACSEQEPKYILRPTTRRRGVHFASSGYVSIPTCTAIM